MTEPEFRFDKYGNKSTLEDKVGCLRQQHISLRLNGVVIQHDVQ